MLSNYQAEVLHLVKVSVSKSQNPCHYGAVLQSTLTFDLYGERGREQQIISPLGIYIQ